MESYNFGSSSCIMRPVHPFGGVLRCAQQTSPEPLPGVQLIDQRGTGPLGNEVSQPIPI
jgi:hypothetical protein